MKLKFLVIFLLFLSHQLQAVVLSKIEVSSLGEVSFSKNTGLSEILEFSIAPDVTSYAIHLTSEAEYFFYVYELIAPDGTKYITKNPQGVSSEELQHLKINGRGQILSPINEWFSVFQGVTSTVVPNNSKVKIQTGALKIMFAIEKDISKDVEKEFQAKVGIVLKKNSKKHQIKKRVLNLNIYATENARIGSNVWEFKQKIEKTINFFSSVGIDIQISNFKKIDSKYDDVSDNQGYTDRFELLRDLWEGKESLSEKGRRSMDVFFTARNNYSNAGIASFLGATLGQIFPTTFNGTIVFTERGKDSSMVFAHELCHHLGLYHTDMDLLSDTKTHKHTLYGDQGREPNLMHVKPDAFFLSPKQLEVIYNNPMLVDHD
jgi:hypothetical protein